MGHWESAGLPDDFDGVVRLFPLPNLVLFPHVIQALHIFEPRYCEMLSEALESDHLITMALLTPGWEHHLQGKPSIGETVCIGRVVSHTPTDDGRHNILLAGISRARIEEELHVDTTFRQARVTILEDYIPEQYQDRIEPYRDGLLNIFRSFIPQDSIGSKTFGDLLTRQLPLGILTDIVAYAVSLPSEVKLALLSEQNVIARCEILMSRLGPVDHVEKGLDLPGNASNAISISTPDFPPPFSNN